MHTYMHEWFDAYDLNLDHMTDAGDIFKGITASQVCADVICLLKDAHKSLHAVLLGQILEYTIHILICTPITT